MLLVRRSHDVGADPGDERFPNRTKPATPGSLRRTVGSAQLAGCRADVATDSGRPVPMQAGRVGPAGTPTPAGGLEGSRSRVSAAECVTNGSNEEDAGTGRGGTSRA